MTSSVSLAGSLYKGKHIMSARDFSRHALEYIFDVTAHIKEAYHEQEKDIRMALCSLLVRDQLFPLRGLILLNGESTRTVSQFESAIEELGGTVHTHLLRFSSLYKGESYWDTAAVLGPQYDLIIVRDDGKERAAQEMADAIEAYGYETRIINAGCGPREHPTHTLTDLFTIWERRPDAFERGRLTYALVGDLSRSRTTHSLLLGLTHFGGTVFLVGPDWVNIPQWLEEELASHPALEIEKVTDPLEIASEVDIWYFTRLQQNLRGRPLARPVQREFERVYGAKRALRNLMKKDAEIMAPLPHGGEIPKYLDRAERRCVYVAQAHNGRFVKMALLKLLFAPGRTIPEPPDKIEVSGHIHDRFLNRFPLPQRNIIVLCPHKGCHSVRISYHGRTNAEWVTLCDPAALTPEFREKKPHVPCDLHGAKS